jgi:hypothetical protein
MKRFAYPAKEPRKVRLVYRRRLSNTLDLVPKDLTFLEHYEYVTELEPPKLPLRYFTDEFPYYKRVELGALLEKSSQGLAAEEQAFLDELADPLRLYIYPEESKCVIILHSDGEDVGKTLFATNKLTALVYDRCFDSLQLTRFYTFVVCDAFDPYEVRSFDSAYVLDGKLGYLYGTRPVFASGKRDGAQYMEVHTPQTLLARFQLRAGKRRERRRCRG